MDLCLSLPGWLLSELRSIIWMATRVAESFSGVEWNQFIPDTLVALITGAVVGVALLVVQRLTDSRRLLLTSAVEWEDLKDRLRRAADGQVVINLGSSAEFGRTIDRLEELSANQPLERWARQLEDPAIRSYLALLDATDRARESGHYFDLILRQETRTIASGDNELLIEMYSRGYGHGLSQLSIQQQMGATHLPRFEVVVAASQQIMERPRVASAFSQSHSNFHEVELRHAQFWVAIGASKQMRDAIYEALLHEAHH